MENHKLSDDSDSTEYLKNAKGEYLMVKTLSAHEKDFDPEDLKLCGKSVSISSERS